MLVDVRAREHLRQGRREGASTRSRITVNKNTIPSTPARRWSPRDPHRDAGRDDARHGRGGDGHDRRLHRPRARRDRRRGRGGVGAAECRRALRRLPAHRVSLRRGALGLASALLPAPSSRERSRKARPTGRGPPPLGRLDSNTRRLNGWRAAFDRQFSVFSSPRGATCRPARAESRSSACPGRTRSSTWRPTSWRRSRFSSLRSRSRPDGSGRLWPRPARRLEPVIRAGLEGR